MIEAKALFTRHWSTFAELIEKRYAGHNTGGNILQAASTIMAACIVAEALRNSLDDPEIK